MTEQERKEYGVDGFSSDDGEPEEFFIPPKPFRKYNSEEVQKHERVWCSEIEKRRK